MENQLSESEMIEREAQQIPQIGREGISYNYFEKSILLMTYCKDVLKITDNAGVPEEESRLIILETMEKFKSYSKYMSRQKKIGGLRLVDSLTPRGKEIVVRLDEIAAEIKSLSKVEDPQKLDVKRVLELLEESQTFIY